MRSGFSRPTTSDSPDTNDTKHVVLGIIGLFAVVALVVGGVLLYFNTTTQNNQASDVTSENKTISLNEIEDQELANKLKQLTPTPDEFSDGFVRNEEKFTKNDNAISYVTTWRNQAANQIEKYRENSGGQLQRPASEDIRSAAQNTQAFSLSISYIGTTTTPFADTKNRFSKLPATVKAMTEENIVANRNLSAIGESHYSYRLSPAANPSNFDYYNFYRNGYLVKFQMFVSMNDNAFEEYILPKARVIDEKIRGL